MIRPSVFDDRIDPRRRRLGHVGSVERPSVIPRQSIGSLDDRERRVRTRVPQCQRDQTALQAAADQHVIEFRVGNGLATTVMVLRNRHELPSQPTARRAVDGWLLIQASPSCSKMCGTAMAASPMNVIRKPEWMPRVCRESPPSHQVVPTTDTTASIDIGATQARKGRTRKDSSRRNRRSPSSECQIQKYAVPETRIGVKQAAKMVAKRTSQR